MKTKWPSSDGAIAHVIELLEQAGAPLELLVADVCNRFCDKCLKLQTAAFSEKIVYSPPNTENEYREVDQCVQIDDEITATSTLTVQLRVQLPIECKYRKDVEFFAFPVSDRRLSRRFPIYSDWLSGSTYFYSLAESQERNLSKLLVASLVALKIEGGEKPQKAYEESLIYNAAGALYDFIYFDLISDQDSFSVNEQSQKANEILDKLGLAEELEKFVKSDPYFWELGLSDWMARTVRPNTFSAYNERFFNERRIAEVVQAHLPIVCVNGPIHSVDWDSSLGIKGFTEIPYCLTSIRKRGWPGRAYEGLITSKPEIPVVVTNPSNLNDVLQLGLSWCQQMKRVLCETSEAAINSWPLEASLYHRASQFAGKSIAQHSYRSDMDFSE